MPNNIFISTVIIEFTKCIGTFRDVTEETQSTLRVRGNGCIAADLNMDGWLDLYVTADGPNALLWNEGDGTFRRDFGEAGLDAPEWSSAASAGDINRDDWPDLFVAAYIDLERQVEKPVGAFPQDYLGLVDHLYVNNQDGTFTEVTDLLGLSRAERGLGSIFSDFDRDGDLDLYIANDGHPNRLYLAEMADNPPGVALVDASLTSNTNDSGRGMGIASGDYNNDGHIASLLCNSFPISFKTWRSSLSRTGLLM